MQVLICFLSHKSIHNTQVHFGSYFLVEHGQKTNLVYKSETCFCHCVAWASGDLGQTESKAGVLRKFWSADCFCQETQGPSLASDTNPYQERNMALSSSEMRPSFYQLLQINSETK